MKEKLVKLINVKSIITLVLTGAFTYLTVTQVIKEQSFMTIFSTVIAFYFGTQSTKKQGL